MKTLSKTLVALMMTSSLAYAGGLVYEAPPEPVIAAAPMGDQADWIVPLIALAAIILLVNNSDGDTPPGECETDCEPPPPDCITKSCVLTEVYGDDDWWNYDAEDEADVREYWVESGRQDGIGDWSGYVDWLND